jgi:hypothetical protein
MTGPCPASPTPWNPAERHGRRTGAQAWADPDLFSAVRQIWEEARTYAARTVNSAMVRVNWLIGRQIVEAQQAGRRRAGYGEALIVTTTMGGRDPSSLQVVMGSCIRTSMSRLGMPPWSRKHKGKAA